MNKPQLPNASALALVSILAIAGTSHASTDLPTLKPTGISIDLYRQKLDLNVDNIEASIPGVTPEMLDVFEPQLNTTNDIDVYSLRLDYQFTPSFNLFGSLGKVKEQTTVEFSDINPALSNLSLDKQGYVYSVGAVYSKNFAPMFASVTVMHSIIDLDDNPHDIKVSGLIPSLGINTRIGQLTGSLLYQEIEAVFTGEITAPFVGPVPVEVSASNDNDIQLLLGLRTQLARDLYLNASAGVNGQEHYQVQLNKRF